MKQPMNTIDITGARTHNLKNISLSIPRDRLTVITGLSGSGKSSLAFDTLYAEGQRRYVESLSSYARQFLDLMDKPDVDSITGLSPAISIEQKSTSHNPRSTVGTITEIHDYLRLLFARAGEPVCPTHHIVLRAQTVTEMTDAVLKKPEGTKIMILAPVVRNRKGEYKELLSELSRQGYIRAMIDGELCDLSDPPELKLRVKHTIEVVVDRLRVRPDARQRIAESFETALKLADGIAYAAEMDNPEKRDVFSEKFSCPECGYSISEIEPRLFSFNNPSGACPECGGLGQKEFIDPKKVLQTPPFQSMTARSAAGITGAPSPTRCLRASRSSTASALRFPTLRSARKTGRGSGTAPALMSSTSITRARTAAPATSTAPLRASSPIWRGASARPRPALSARS